ncbi:MAG TPA: hypothetical protein PLU87_12750 [Sedimentisphaerales bacterium]|nr:hypothetical protein [Sedimentisphaerales bacterium]HRS11909.1 hypothetical protein [Sedimentisphaerales bacterium]HRV48586.1 hypothetical protein [Sedimentisphaerales bacterium]
MDHARFLRPACITVAASLLWAAPAAATFRAAIAVRCVTPETLLPVSGGVGPSSPTTRKVGELTVRAMVLERNGTRVAICSTDFLGFPGVLCEKVREQVFRVPADHILIGATHTHSAPDCYGFPDQTGQTSCDLAYLDSICSALAQAIDDASADLQPATVKIATGNAQGRIAYNYYAERLYDPRCHVLQVLGRDRKPIATLVNYACHPEVLGSDQGILSPDFVGPLYDRIEAKGGGTGIFLNSAQGGMVTADCRGPDGKDIRTWDECIRIGHLLADEALRIVGDAPIQDDPELLCRSATMRLPVENDMLRAVVQLSPLGFQLDDEGCVATRIHVVNVGDAQMATIPGEALPNIGYYLKRKMHGRHNFLLGLTNDAFGYILTKEDFDSFDRYDYITRTSLGERTGEILVTSILELVNTCPRPAAATH